MVDLKQLIDAGVHFGHKTSRWSPKMAGYIWGSRNGVHLIDVSKTAFLLQKAGERLFELAKNGGQILLVGTKKSAREIIKKAATDLNMPSVVDRWIGGTLTNSEQVKKAATRLLHLRDVIGKSDLHLGKKELSMLTKEVARLERNVGGIIDLAYPPAALVIVDAKKEYSAIREASYIGIPVIGLVDTNTNPEGVTCVIPGNDDSPRAVACIIAYLTEQIAKGIAEYQKNKPAEVATPKVAKTERTSDRTPHHPRDARGPKRPHVQGGHKPAAHAKPEAAAAVEAVAVEVKVKETVVEAVTVETAVEAKAPKAAAKPMQARRAMTTRKPAADAKDAKAETTAEKKPAAKKPAAKAPAKPAAKKEAAK